jgi:hypothetical protein
MARLIGAYFPLDDHGTTGRKVWAFFSDQSAHGFMSDQNLHITTGALLERVLTSGQKAWRDLIKTTIVGRHRILMGSILFGILLITSGCGDSPESARRKLASLSLNFTKEEFVQSVQQGDKTVVALFIKAGMNPNLTYDNEQQIPVICFAEGNNHPEIVQMLLQNGANPDMASKEGITPMHLAISESSPDIVSLLLKWKADPNLKDIGPPLLIQACSESRSIRHKVNPTVVKLLLNVKLNKDMISYDTSIGDHGLVVQDMTVEAFGKRSKDDPHRLTTYEEGPCQHDDANVFREIDSWCQTVWHRRFLSSNLVAINSIECNIGKGSHRHDKGELNAHSVGHQTLQRRQ